MTPRPCTWPDGGCGEPILDVTTRAGKRQVLDAEPAKGIVLGELATIDTEDDAIAISLGADQSAGRIVAVVVDVYRDHHAACDAWLTKVERERAARQAAKAGRG